VTLSPRVYKALGWLSAVGFALIFVAGLAQSFEATGKAPGIYTGYNGALDLLLSEEDKAAAFIPQLELALQIVVNEQHIQNHNLGLALQGVGRLDEATAHYRAAIATRPEYGPSHIQLGDALFAKGQVTEGIEHLEEAHRINPKDANILVQLGVGHGKMRALDLAASRYREAIALDPRHPIAHFNLARVLHVSGAGGEAIPMYQRAIALDHRYEPRALPYLRQLGVVIPGPTGSP
jgi:tetratricopeptide (TPR) repeat protein